MSNSLANQGQDGTRADVRARAVPSNTEGEAKPEYKRKRLRSENLYLSDFVHDFTVFLPWGGYKSYLQYWIPRIGAEGVARALDGRQGHEDKRPPELLVATIRRDAQRYGVAYEPGAYRFEHWQETYVEGIPDPEPDDTEEEY